MLFNHNTYTCPTCNSENIIKLSLIHRNGLSSGDTHTEGHSIAEKDSERKKIYSKSITTHQTQASIDASPPSELKSLQDILYEKIGAGIGGYLISVFVVFVANALIRKILMSIHFDFLINVVNFIIFVLIFFALPYFFIENTKGECKSCRKSYPQILVAWEDEYLNWQNSYECQKCEERFVIYK